MLVAQSCLTLCDLMDCDPVPARLLCPWSFPGKNSVVSCYSLLQGIFPTQGSNPGLPHCRWILYQLSHKGNPRILEWVLFSFPPPGDLPDPGIEPGSPALQTDSSPSEPSGTLKSESESHSVVSDSLRSHGIYSPWNSPGQDTGVGSLSLLQGIFPTRGLNLGLPHCRRILYQLSYQGSPH